MEYTNKEKSYLRSKIKKKFLEASVSGYPVDRDPYKLTTDASLISIGAVLSQNQGKEDQVVANASRNLN